VSDRSVGITEHAVSRFRERVRPDLGREAAGKLLLFYAQTEKLLTEPPWEVPFYKDVVGWLPCGFGGVGIAVPHRKHGHPVVVTCVANPNFRVIHPKEDNG
jgi:hypothetical protein